MTTVVYISHGLGITDDVTDVAKALTEAHVVTIAGGMADEWARAELLRRSDHVYCMPDFDESEVAFARRESIPVFLPEHGSIADFVAAIT